VFLESLALAEKSADFEIAGKGTTIEPEEKRSAFDFEWLD
jgi:hypothetical protein